MICPTCKREVSITKKETDEFGKIISYFSCGHKLSEVIVKESIGVDAHAMVNIKREEGKRFSKKHKFEYEEIIGERIGRDGKLVSVHQIIDRTKNRYKKLVKQGNKIIKNTEEKLSNHKITYSIIQKSQLEGAHRLDAEYYQPEYLNLISKIKSQKSKPLKDFLKLLYRYPTFYNLQYYTSGVLILKGEDILTEGFVQNQSQDYISEEDAERFPKTILKEGDLIFSVRGYVGKVGIVDKKYDGSIISANLIRIVVKDVSPHFLWVYLNSNYGIKQINRVKMITAQETIIADDIKNFLVPVVDKKEQLEIEGLAKQAIKEIRESEYLYSQAEDLLLKELGLKNFEIKDDLSYIVNLSEVKSAHRADAEYFQPKYKKLIEEIKKQNTELLGRLAKRVKTKVKPRPEKNYKYIEISDINTGSGDVDFDEIAGRELSANAQIPIKGGELLVSKVRPTRRAISIIPDHFNDHFICSSAFSIFKVPEVLREYLFVILRSMIGILQFEKPTAGTSYPTITDQDVENIVIPILSKLTQQKIANLVQKSHEARLKAKQLLKQAKSKVENLIQG